MTAIAAPAETLEKSTDKSVPDAVDAFLAILGKKGATVFSVVEHAKGAEKVGMEMKPATLVIFGNPKLGTPLMLESATIGIDLPMKALFLEDEDGKTKVIYTDIEKAVLDSRARAQFCGIPRDAGGDRRTWIIDSLPRGRLSECWRVLVARSRHHDDHGRNLHPRLLFL